MKNTPKFIYTAAVFILLGAFSAGLILLAKGYTLTPKEGSVALGKTGWLLMKSSPDGAKTFLNDKATTPTNNSIGGLEENIYSVRIQKEGYHEWKKEVPVKAELVTIIDALLIKKAAEVKPITLTGVKLPTPDDSNTQIAYYAEGDEQAGLWVYSLNGGLMGTGRTNPALIAEGTEFKYLSQLEWSPDSQQMIVTITNEDIGLKREVLLRLDQNNISPYPSIQKSTAENKRAEWLEERKAHRIEIASSVDLPNPSKEIILNENTLISPDENKFLYTVNSEKGKEYHLINSTKPLPIGLEEEIVVYTHAVNEETKIMWHTTSEHFLVVEGNTISIMELDGSNKTALFQANLYDALVIPSPNGRNIIINTTFTNTTTPNLHSIYFN